MNDKKAAKLIIRRSKKNPLFYTKDEIRYAKLIKKLHKKKKKLDD